MTANCRVSECEFEVCANSAKSALEAERAGATRVELCAGIPEGGTTPSAGEIAVARKLLKRAKLHVIIRPRGGDFLYDEVEFKAMMKDIEVAKSLGADGVVIGCLNADGAIDIEKTSRLIRKAGKKMSVTFHRAFDMCKNPEEAIMQLAELGVNRILTSGCRSTAFEGRENIKRFVEIAGNKISIMAGCGVNEKNIAQLAIETGCRQFHFSAREKVESKMQWRNASVSMGADDADEYAIMQTTRQRVKETISQLKK